MKDQKKLLEEQLASQLDVQSNNSSVVKSFSKQSPRETQKNGEYQGETTPVKLPESENESHEEDKTQNEGKKQKEGTP